MWEEDSVILGDNIKEWSQYFGGKLPTADIKYVIYKADITPLFDLQVKWKFKQFQLHPALDTNRLIQRLVAKPDSEFLQYILYAKTCEPFVTNRDYWDPDNSHKSDTDTLLILAKRGEHYYNSCHSSFLKLRYGYQVVRLLRYVEDWESSIASYDKLIAPLKVQSIIRYWALEQKAGALYKLDRHGEGAYWFSRVFSECPSRRSIAYASFSITSDSVWKDCMDRCKTTKEKTALFFLRGINPRNSVIDEMKSIYSLDPGSEFLPVLLSREINRLENEGFPSDPMGSYWGRYTNSPDTLTIHILRQFIDMCVFQKKVIPTDMWKLASSYLQYLDGDDITAKRTLLNLKASSRTKNILQAIPCFEAYYDVAHLKELDDTSENNLYTRVLSTKHDKLQEYTISKFQQLYTDQDDTIKAFLCSHGLSDLKKMLNPAMTDQVIQWSKKENPTSFDQFLLINRLYSRDGYYYEGGAQGQNGLLEVKGTIILGQNKLDKALEVFKLIPENEQWRSSADPFSSRIKDCRDCDFSDKAQKTYSHLFLVQSIIENENRIKTDPKHAAMYHQLLGNVYYNLTHFGNASEGLTFTHNCDRWFHDDAIVYKKTGKINFDVDCSLARKHYVEAMKLAESSGNLEQAAECCFMAAKCEQNEYYVTVISDDENKTTKKTYYRTLFKQMKERYSKTQFYGKAIHECKYFNYFVSR
jgi:hypothetical protein